MMSEYQEWMFEAGEPQVLSDHAYISLVIPPENRLLLAIVLIGIGIAISYLMVKAILYTAERVTEA
ncbi:MAG: hypothetical protein LUQ31_10250 [Methanoregula sp.]|nr:hypothetical protein [Methanoregula sp.]